jgi:hypothetical protein
MYKKLYCLVLFHNNNVCDFINTTKIKTQGNYCKTLFAVFERAIRTLSKGYISVPINNVNPSDHVKEILSDVGDHLVAMLSLSSFSYARALI